MRPTYLEASSPCLSLRGCACGYNLRVCFLVYFDGWFLILKSISSWNIKGRLRKQQTIHTLATENILVLHIRTGTCGVTSRCALEKLQNRVIRIITDTPYEAPAKPLLRQLRLPSIAEMIRQEFASIAY